MGNSASTPAVSRDADRLIWVDGELRPKDKIELMSTGAGYLCELNGAPIEAESNTAMPTGFLMQQMAWREALDEARTAAAIEALADEVTARQQALQDGLGALLDEQQDWAAAPCDAKRSGWTCICSAFQRASSTARSCAKRKGRSNNSKSLASRLMP